MADTKISDLTAVVTPASTDEFAVNQGGTSKKETRAQVHALQSGEHLVLPQVDEEATPTLAFGDGDSGIYESADDTLRLAIAGSSAYIFNVTAMVTANAAGPGVYHEAGTATNPTLVPNRTSGSTTGIGGIDGEVSVIIGGVEAINVDAARTTSFAGVAQLWSRTTAQMNAISSPAAGMMVFNSTDGEPFYYSGADWLSCVDGLAED